MSSTMMQIKPEDLDTAEKRGKYTIAIIGCGQNGILHAYLFAEAGFKVTCVDPDPAIINLLAKGKAPFINHAMETKFKDHARNGRINATNDTKTAVSQADSILIAVPVKIDKKRKPDYADIENHCKRVGAGLHRGSLIVSISVVGISVTQGLIRETLENNSGLRVGTDFGLAYSPTNALNGNTLENFPARERIVAAIDRQSLSAASTLLQAITKERLREVEDLKTAEAVALFRIVHQDVDIALANEFAIFCENARIDYNSVAALTLSLPALAGTDTHESHILQENAENLNTKLRMPATAREVNEETVKHAVNLVKDALKNCGKTLKRARITLLGISHTQDMKSSLKKAAKELAETLEARGAKISIYDPHLKEDELAEIPFPKKKSLTEALEGADCIVILTAHDQFKRLNLKKLKITMRMPAAIVDFDNTFEPDKIEKEDLTYRGLGRGVWKK